MTTYRRLRPRKDANEPEIVDELRSMGYSVESDHNDILISGNGIVNNIRIEIKDPARTLNKDGRIKPADKVFTASQLKLMRDWKGQYDVCWDVDEILAVIEREPKQY